MYGIMKGGLSWGAEGEEYWIEVTFLISSIFESSED